MNITEFKASLTGDNPPAELQPALQALWQAGKGNWNAAHEVAQEHDGDQACSWVHAYLHRQEGDLNNAAYWYRRASKPVNKQSLEEEWLEISTALLTANS
jgi:hypothetical protein